MRTFHLILLTALTLGLAACASSPNNRATGPGAQGENAQGQRYGSDTSGRYDQAEIGQEQLAGGKNGQTEYDNPFENPKSKLSQRRIFFPFDSNTIVDRYKPILDAHAQYLIDHDQAHVRLAGHADERGTREYNIGLARRRAKAVARYLKLQGVPANRITTISYGEEKPLVQGHDSQAWSKNRRVHIIYTNRDFSG